ncbi:MAG: hypothetical protein CMH27_00610 [Micavibrio sp.]|nr:hypothetical protein [Micavibrio sp.]|tara:strand:+ start:3424 stop:3972 length:549 start_codon:yes stop_codon:yes gene_type:complete
MGAKYYDIDEEWRELAIRAQAGDRQAYSSLLKAIADFVKNYLIPRLANPDWADDITQDVLLSVHKSLKTYSAKRPFKPWLMAIVNFRKTDYLRKHYSGRYNMHVELSDLNLKAEHVTNMEYVGELKDIETILGKLKGKHRVIFEKMRIYGYTAQEVADELGMGVSAVKVSVHRSQKKLEEHN